MRRLLPLALLLVGAGKPSTLPESGLVDREAKAAREAGEARAKHAQWCLGKKMPVRARWAYEAALRWDPRNAAWKAALGAIDPESPDTDDPKLQYEVQDRQKALDKASARSFLKLGQEAAKAGIWGMARRMAAYGEALDAGSEEGAALRKALEGKEALKALDADLERARTGHLLKPGSKDALEYLLKLPKGHDPAEDRCPVFVFVHGSGGRAENAADGYESFRSAGFALLAPTCESSRSKADPGKEAEQLLAVLDRLCADLGLARDQVFVAGHSGGGNVTYTMIDKHRARLRGAIPLEANFYVPIAKSPKPDPFPVYVLKGEKDEHNEALLNAQIAAALEALKRAQLLNVKFEVVPEMTHSNIHLCEERMLEWCQAVLSGAKK